jgi:hypothetical protein
VKRAKSESRPGLLARYEAECNDFLPNIASGDESWVLHCDARSKSLSLDYPQIFSSTNKK